MWIRASLLYGYCTDWASGFAGSASYAVVGVHNLSLAILELQNPLRTHVYTASAARALGFVDYGFGHGGSPLVFIEEPRRKGFRLSTQLLLRGVIALVRIEARVEPPAGFEPATTGLRGRRSTGLSYGGSLTAAVERGLRFVWRARRDSNPGPPPSKVYGLKARRSTWLSYGPTPLSASTSPGF